MLGMLNINNKNNNDDDLRIIKVMFSVSTLVVYDERHMRMREKVLEHQKSKLMPYHISGCLVRKVLNNT